MGESDHYSDPGINAVGYITCMFFFLSLLIVYIIREYANPKLFPWHTYATIFIGYFCSFAVLLLVPLDLALTVTYRNPENPYYDNEHFASTQKMIVTFFIAFFWPTFILGSLGMVFQEYYNLNGNFTLLSRLIDSFLQMSFWYFLGLIGGIIFFAVLITKHYVSSSFAALTLVAIVISNTAGLVALMVLLGYGLVELPRQLWNDADLEHYRLRVQQHAASQYRQQQETSLAISLMVSDAMKTKQEIGKYEDPAIADAMAVVLRDCPSEFTSATLGTVAADKHGKITLSSLANLHTNLIKTQGRYKIAQGRMETTKKMYYYLDDVCNAKIRSDNIRRIKWSFKPEGNEWEYKMHTKYYPLSLKVMSIICLSLSLFCYLGIIGSMTGHKSHVSPFSLAIHDNGSSSVGIAVLALLTMGYTCYVTMWSVFQMRIADMMELQPNQQTYPKSLSVSCRACSRLATPVAFYYLGWVFENGVEAGDWMNVASVIDLPASSNTSTLSFSSSSLSSATASNTTISTEATTAFSQFYQIQVVPFLGDAFNTAFPVLLFITSFFVLINALNRILIFLKLGAFQFGTEIVTEEEMVEGKRQLERHRKAMVRAVQRQNLGKITRKRRSSVLEAGVSLLTHILIVFGIMRKDSDEVHEEREEDVMDREGHTEPDALAGMVEKKASSMLSRMTKSANWKHRWMQVKRPGILLTYKDRESASEEAMQSPLTRNELRVLVTINTSPDSLSLDLEFPDEVLTLRFSSSSEAITWKEGLYAWRDFAINYDLFRPTGDLVDELNREINEEMEREREKEGRAEERKRKTAQEQADKYLDNLNFTEEAASDSSDAALVKRDQSFLSLSPSRSLSHSISNPMLHQNTPESLSGREREREREEREREIESGSGSPSPLQGWIDKKQHKSQLGMITWQRRYFRVDEHSGCLLYSKNDKMNK